MAEIVTLARTETERGELVLRRRDESGAEPIYEIISNGVFLMASTNGHSARQLTYLGLEPLLERDRLRVLVGGLGMGYTVQATLEHSQVATVEVVEVEPLIVEWARAYFGPLNGEALRDERVRVVVSDLAVYLKRTDGPYDAFLLDIDNGPNWLVFEENAAVYSPAALARMRELLTPGGVVAVWAAARSPEFLTALEHSFAWADEIVVVEEAEGRESEYFIYRAGKA